MPAAFWSFLGPGLNCTGAMCELNEVFKSLLHSCVKRTVNIPISALVSIWHGIHSGRNRNSSFTYKFSLFMFYRNISRPCSSTNRPGPISIASINLQGVCVVKTESSHFLHKLFIFESPIGITLSPGDSNLGDKDQLKSLQC